MRDNFIHYYLIENASRVSVIKYVPILQNYKLANQFLFIDLNDKHQHKNRYLQKSNVYFGVFFSTSYSSSVLFLYKYVILPLNYTLQTLN